MLANLCRLSLISISNQVMKKFLSCDWGTTSFRLRLVEIANARVIAEENSNHGIAKVFEMWKQSGESASTRFYFYCNVVSRHMETLKNKLSVSLEGFPIVISGMACSTFGMVDLPYADVPFSTDGSDLITELVAADNNFKHHMIFISGAKTESDVMRGEETQLVGCLHDKGEQLFIFPGTHSKHITVSNGKAVDIKTYMTGEFFELLSAKSILAASVEGDTDITNEKSRTAFEAGLKESLRSNLLHSSFTVRTNYLFHKLTQPENYHYLSGLLIGTEMKEVTANVGDITLVSSSHLNSQYETAFNLIVNNSRELRIQNAGQALIVGQLKMLNRVFN
jgi:2-dehydro-3-deoxygalactonokinase